MRVVPRRSGRLLVVSRAVLAGLLLALFAAGGCAGASGTSADGGGSQDAGTPDAGTPDAGSRDGGGSDAGATCGAAPVADCGPCADGTACGGGTSVCWQGACAPGCVIQGTYYPTGVANPAADCEVCDPTTQWEAWSPAADGTACTNDGNDCTTDACAAGQCEHTPVAAGGACGTSGQCDASGHCSQGCTIGGQFIPDGTADPNNPCQLCVAARSATSWSDGPDGTACADDGDPCTRDVCAVGLCAHPWANAGTACGSGQVCDAIDHCAPGCFIGGQLLAPGAPDPANACQACKPSVSTSAWSPVTDGTDCDDGNLCNGVSTCVSGACVQTTPPPTCTPPGPCYDTATCDPSTGVCAFLAAPAGQSCGTGLYCDGGGSCVAGCFIGGQFYADGATNPATVCQVCDVATSTSAWSAAPLGTVCPVGFCDGTGLCQGGCFIGGQLYANGQRDPANSCLQCDPAANSWILVPAGWGCASDGNDCTNDMCDGTGLCTHPPLPAGNPCGTNACDASTGAGWCDSNGTCDRCDSGGTSCCVAGATSCSPANGSTVTCQ